MLGETTRQRIATAGVTALGLVSAGTAIAGKTEWSIGGLSLMVTIAVLMLFDLRRRSNVLDRRAKVMNNRTKTLGKLVNSLQRFIARTDYGQQRVIAAIEAGRLDQVDGMKEENRRLNHMTGQLDSIARLAEQVASTNHEDLLRLARDAKHADSQSHRELLRELRGQTAEVEALFQLFPRQLRAPLPPSGRWAMRPTGILNLMHEIERRRPRLVLELGSGTSTVWIGNALRAAGTGKLVTVDHLAQFVQQTRSAILLHELEEIVNVREAPLEPVVIGSTNYSWYAYSSLDDLHDIDMLVVDGPPASVGSQARFPAVPMLASRLAPGATVIVDDATRPDEEAMVSTWKDMFPALVEAYTPIPTQANLRWTS